MTSCDFSTETHGKWILAGEHAVLRGFPVVVFPVLNKTLTLSYFQDQSISAEFEGLFADDAHLLFWSTLERGLEYVNKSLSSITGKFILKNDIPVGAGMGSSAALCSAIARWFLWRAWIKADEVFSFARELENLFHGQSSGIDILGALNNTGMLYVPGQKPKALAMSWRPNWYLSNTQQLGITSHCVKKVVELHQHNPSLAKRIDITMHESVLAAVNALEKQEENGRLEQLASAINQARLCFTQWGLVSGNLEQQINYLLSQGALAAKPTGSGDGGYVLSLWPGSESRPKNLQVELVAV
jgi:mevalonate kinase